MVLNHPRCGSIRSCIRRTAETSKRQELSRELAGPHTRLSPLDRMAHRRFARRVGPECTAGRNPEWNYRLWRGVRTYALRLSFSPSLGSRRSSRPRNWWGWGIEGGYRPRPGSSPARWPWLLVAGGLVELARPYPGLWSLARVGHWRRTCCGVSPLRGSNEMTRRRPWVDTHG
jgi:hypothetical protein